MYRTDRKKQIQVKVNCALLIALEIIFTRFLSIQTPMLRISFAFVPLALAGSLYGPVYGFIVGMSADLLGMVLFSTGGFHLGFTLVTALTGAVYGLLLHRKDGEEKWSRFKVVLRSVTAAFIINIFLEMGLNTLWLSQILHKGYLALLPPRAVKQVIMMGIQSVMLPVIVNTLAEQLLRLQNSMDRKGTVKRI